MAETETAARMQMPGKEIELKYEPHRAQQPFHLDRYRVFHRLCSAGSGAGKTLCGAFEALSWLLENPGSVGYAFEPTYKMVKRNLIPTLEGPLLLDGPLNSSPVVHDWNKADSHLTLINSSQLWLIGMDDPESAEGPNVDFIWADEARLMPHFEEAWQVWVRRLRGSVPGRYPRGLFATTTPDAPGTPLFRRFEDPQKKEPSSKVYRWSIFDNPHLPKDFIDAMVRTHTGGLYDRFVLGRFANVSSGSFEFDSTRHVLDPCKMPGTAYPSVIYGVDFGWTNPTAVVAVGMDGDGRAYALDEYYQSRVRTEDLISELREMQQKWGPGTIVCDRSAPGTIEEIRRAGLPAKADESKRDDGILALASRFRDARDGRSRIYVASGCVNLIAELQTYSAEIKENDHAVDALRYALSSTAARQQGPPAMILY